MKAQSEKLVQKAVVDITSRGIDTRVIAEEWLSDDGFKTLLLKKQNKVWMHLEEKCQQDYEFSNTIIRALSSYYEDGADIVVHILSN